MGRRCWTSFFFFFFLFIQYSYATYVDHGEGHGPYVQSVSPPQSTYSGMVQAVIALHPGLSREVVIAHQGNYKGNARPLLPYSTDAMKDRLGKNSGVPSPAPISSSAPSFSVCFSSSSSAHSRSSPSDTSLPTSPSFTTGGTFFPMSVEDRKSSIAWKHCPPPAKSS